MEFENSNNHKTDIESKIVKTSAAGIRMREMKKPVAIAMWDFSWLLRHHKLGEFEDWDKVLDELVERGYDAVRIDCFPYLVASDDAGRIEEEFYCPKTDWSPALWGNQYSIHVRPRQALLEFLPKCRARGVRVGLATWFSGHGTGRNEIFEGVEGFVRAWDETLLFLNENGLLEDILYVDLLNEYPINNAYSWLRKAMLADEKGIAIEDIEVKTVGIEHIYSPDKGQFHTKYHLEFMNQVIERLSAKWTYLDFFASLTPFTGDVPWEDMADISHFAALDMHHWFILETEFGETTKYWEDVIHFRDNDMLFAGCHLLMKKYWKENREKLIQWMENEISMVEQTAKKYGIPCGNTEGWGAINWVDHPCLDWEFVKEAGEICAQLAVKHGYKFICTSNFTHPQFPGIWNDVQWHKKVTSIIRKG